MHVGLEQLISAVNIQPLSARRETSRNRVAAAQPEFVLSQVLSQSRHAFDEFVQS
ncbi:hypothetical protein FEAC_25650 [Ferrimicrobium acidiphilum DSM 19497]|uniref:Uncharacterized protein n=1 Tax=Ferrimicrobium acidiphilum DSM 19497 TaxID=1121877 RepID=A0A0D8FR31_9ACTN|nr:hypothetical protein FEAC_25650 [Ferrimicrobium acidiphilum DSM 19497]